MKHRRTALIACTLALIVVVAGFGIWYVYLRPVIGGDGPPHCEITRDPPSGRTYVVSDMSVGGVLWSDVAIRLADASTHDDYLEFAPTNQELENGGGQITGLFKHDGVPTQIGLNLTDMYVRFVVGDGDYFTLVYNGTSLLAGSLYEISLFNEPYGSVMGLVQFRA